MTPKNKKRFTEYLEQLHKELTNEYKLLELTIQENVHNQNTIAEKISILETVRSEWRKENGKRKN